MNHTCTAAWSAQEPAESGLPDARGRSAAADLAAKRWRSGDVCVSCSRILPCSERPLMISPVTIQTAPPRYHGSEKGRFLLRTRLIPNLVRTTASLLESSLVAELADRV